MYICTYMVVYRITGCTILEFQAVVSSRGSIIWLDYKK